MGLATGIAANNAGDLTIQWHSVTGFDDDQTLRDLITSNAEPVIVQVNSEYTGHDHFVLVTGLSGNTFTINDPGYTTYPYPILPRRPQC